MPVAGKFIGSKIFPLKKSAKDGKGPSRPYFFFNLCLSLDSLALNLVPDGQKQNWYLMSGTMGNSMYVAIYSCSIVFIITTVIKHIFHN